MAGSNNFLNWNPSTANTQADGTYSADTTRENGFSTNQPWLSPLGNKMLHQICIMAAALGQMLAMKGYGISDASQSALAAALANILTNADLVSLGVIGSSSLPLSIANGGTGQTSLSAAGIPQVISEVELSGLTSSIGTTLLLTPASAGFYRLSQQMKASGGAANAHVNFVQHGVAGLGNSISCDGSVATASANDESTIYADAGAPITYYASWVPNPVPGSYDLHIRIEKVA